MMTVSTDYFMMTVSTGYVMMTISTGYVMMTVSTQQEEKLRNSCSIPNIRKGVLSALKRTNRLYKLSASCQGVQDDHSVAVKRTGRDAIMCCPVLDEFLCNLQHCLSECYQILLHFYNIDCRN